MKHIEKFGVIVIVDDTLNGNEWYFADAYTTMITSDLYKAGATVQDIEAFWKWWREYSKKPGFAIISAGALADFLIRMGVFVPKIDLSQGGPILPSPGLSGEVSDAD